MSGKPRVVLLGMMSRMPVAGVVWQYLHYLLGFERLGFETYYVEAHAGTPSMLMRDKRDDSSQLAADFISGVLGRFGFGDRWAFNALHDDGRVYGLSSASLERLYGSAELLVNLHGATRPSPELAATGRLVYLETDPVQLQLELHHDVPETVEFLEQHAAFFTFAENWGHRDCDLPRSDRFEFRPTRQPVVVDLWEGAPGPPRRGFTTVGNWKQDWRILSFEGETYSWSKHHGFLRYLELARRTDQPLELALSKCDADDRRLLSEHGWQVRDAAELSGDIDLYRRYIQESRGELTVAKDQNVRLRSGWFSDRSATYLAAGRPVVTEETGFSNVLPSGRGLFGFASPDEAVAALEAIGAEYELHCAAASELAREWFSHEVVLGRLLADLGIAPPRRRDSKSSRALFPRGMVVVPESRRPLRLPRPTVRTVMRRPVPTLLGSAPRPQPVASIVVVTHNALPLTRLCIETVIANTARVEFELIVVDNGSRDGTVAHLARLARGHARVRALANGANTGFARGCNEGAAIARGSHLVLLNNDTMVPPGWLPRLLAHARDPGVGLVGPLTNRIGNEAEIETDYRTWGEFLRFAGERARAGRGRSFEIGVPTMFCLALRRDVWERLGPLDERFETGLLEDDDYAERAREAGYSLRCAEDVFVHHFGEGSFGKLVPTGEYQRLLKANKRRFEAKWGRPWQPYGRRFSEEYSSLRARVRELVAAEVPPGSVVLVVSRGDEELLRFDGRTGMHFPQGAGGVYAGDHPADSAAAIAQLEELRSQGAGYLVIPRTAAWWLDHYEGLRRHLDANHATVAADRELALIYELDGTAR